MNGKTRIGFDGKGNRQQIYADRRVGDAGRRKYAGQRQAQAVSRFQGERRQHGVVVIVFDQVAASESHNGGEQKNQQQLPGPAALQLLHDWQATYPL